MPGLFVKDAGVWKEVTDKTPQVKVGATWTPVKEVHVRDAGTWKKVWPTVLPATPANLRFGYATWANNRYEVQALWDPVLNVDSYDLEVTRQGGANPVNAQVVTGLTTNYWNDIYPGTTGGIVLYYRVRSKKGSTVGAWSNMISATSPGDPGFCYTNFFGAVGDVWGNIYVQVVHDGNANNIYYDMTRSQSGKATVSKRFSIASTTQNLVDKVDGSYYSGPHAVTTNTTDSYSDEVTWDVYTVNSWGKPNPQNGNPYPLVWGHFANQACWRFSNFNDGTVRINAVGTNVYRRQPTNSVGWVGGVPRCGGNQGDMEGCWLWDKNLLSDVALRNRARNGMQMYCGFGRRNDGGNLNVTFTLCGVAMKWGMSDPPGPLTSGLFVRTWQRNQGELFAIPSNWRDAFHDPAANHATFSVVGDNTANTYAEFGYQGEIMGGWVNGQINYISSYF